MTSTNIEEPLAKLSDGAAQERDGDIEDGLAHFRRAKRRLEAELKELQSRVRDVKGRLKRVERSIDEHEAGGSASNTQDTSEGLLEWVTEALQKEAPKDWDQLHPAAVAWTKSMGRSGTGVHGTLKKVLKDSRFVLTKDGYMLKSAAKQSA